MRASGDVPLVKLATSGFKHKDTRVGYVTTPSFTVIGRAPRDTEPTGEPTTAELLNDEIGF
jgi:hypothetical protein